MFSYYRMCSLTIVTPVHAYTRTQVFEGARAYVFLYYRMCSLTIDYRMWSLAYAGV